MARRVAGIFPLIFVLCMLLFPVPCRAAGITVVDDAGRTVVLAAPAERIVSFYAGHSENILALGGAGRLVGIAEGDDETLFPGVPRLPMRADAERILALAPDLVLVRPLAESVNEGVLRTLERSGVPVVSLSPPIPETMEAYLERLSSLLGAEGGVNLWKETLALLKAQIPPVDAARPLVFLETSAKGLRTCAPGSWAALLLSLAGGVNAAASAVPLRPESPLANWGEERLLALAAEGLDVYIVQTGAMNPVTEADVLARPWIKGVHGAEIVLLPEEDISRPSLLRMKTSVEMLRAIFERGRRENHELPGAKEPMLSGDEEEDER